MRKIDKLKNLQSVNFLTEQRYVKSKELIKESFGPTTDVDGVTDGLIGYYKDAILGEQSMDWTSEKVYYLVKKTLDGQGADAETKKALYLMLADKINQLIQRMPESSVRAELETESKSYNHMARMSDKPIGNTSDLMNHLGNMGNPSI